MGKPNVSLPMNLKTLRCCLVLLLAPLLLAGCNPGFFRRAPAPPKVQAVKLPVSVQPAPAAAVPSPVPAPVPAAPPVPPPPAPLVPSPVKTVPKPAVPLQVPPAKNPDTPVIPPEPRKRLAPAKAPDRISKGEIITEDVSWRGEVLVEGDVTVAPQATLYIEPGTVIRFRGSEAHGGIALLVQGRLVAGGSADSPITFSSDFAAVRAGDWQGVMLLASEKNNLLQHCVVEGAETGVEAVFSRLELKETRFTSCRTGAAFHESLVTVTGGQIRNCSVGIVSEDSEADIQGVGFVANVRALRVNRTSLSLEGSSFLRNEQEAVSAESSRVRIRGNIFSINGSGLSLTGCEGGITGNQATKNKGYGVRLVRSRIKVNGNEIASNGGIGLTAEEGRSVVWGNVLTDNGGYDLYNAGSEEITAIGNWWGKKEADIAKRIYGRHLDAAAGPVRFTPVLRTMPPLARR